MIRGKRQKNEQRNQRQHHPQKHVQGTASRGREGNLNRLDHRDASALLRLRNPVCVRAVRGGEKNPRAVSIIPGGGANFRQNKVGGTLLWTPAVESDSCGT